MVTAWLTVHRKPGTVGQFDYGMLVLVLGVIAAAVYLSWLDFQGATSEIDHEPYQAAIVFGSLALIAAAFDVKVILPGGISGAQRISRHLWLAKLAS